VLGCFKLLSQFLDDDVKFVEFLLRLTVANTNTRTDISNARNVRNATDVADAIAETDVTHHQIASSDFRMHARTRVCVSL